MTRTGQDAIDYARGTLGITMPEGYCLAWTRENFAVPALYGSALDAGLATNVPHPGDRNPPAAVPVWFRTSSVYDHVCFFVSPTEVISTYATTVRRFNGIADVERQFYGTFVGWAEDINEVRVWAPETPPGDLTGETTMLVIRGFDTPQVYVTDGITRRYLDQAQEVSDTLKMTGQTEPLVVGQYTIDRIPKADRS